MNICKIIFFKFKNNKLFYFNNTENIIFYKNVKLYLESFQRFTFGSDLSFKNFLNLNFFQNNEK